MAGVVGDERQLIPRPNKEGLGLSIFILLIDGRGSRGRTAVDTTTQQRRFGALNFFLLIDGWGSRGRTAVDTTTQQRRLGLSIFFC